MTDDETNGESALHHFRERRRTDPDGGVTPPPRVPDAGDPHVSQPEVLPGARRDIVTRFQSMALKLIDIARLMQSQALELETGRTSWTQDDRREWHGRLRRLGVDLDTYLSTQLP